MKPFAKNLWNRSWTDFFVFCGPLASAVSPFCVLLCDKKTSPYYSRSIRSSLDPIFNWIFSGMDNTKKSHVKSILTHIHSMAKSNSCFFLFGTLVLFGTQILNVWMHGISTYMKTISSIHVGKYTSSPIECFVWKEVTLE